MNIKNTDAGFSLIETLAGVTIFLIAFIAFMQVSRSSLETINQTKNKIAAQYLAEEGIEYAKQLQKSFLLQGKTREEFLELMQVECPRGCEFYTGNNTTQNTTGALHSTGLFITPNGGVGAVPGSIGRAKFLGEGKEVPLLSVFNRGAIALEKVYESYLGESEYTRLVTFRDVTIDPLLAQSVEVTSRVQIISKAAHITPSEVVVTEVIHFDFH